MIVEVFVWVLGVSFVYLLAGVLVACLVLGFVLLRGKGRKGTQ